MFFRQKKLLLEKFAKLDGIKFCKCFDQSKLVLFVYLLRVFFHQNNLIGSNNSQSKEKRNLLKCYQICFRSRKVLKAYYFSNQGKKYVAGVHRITINLIFRNYLCGKKSGSYTSLYELHSCKSFAIQH